MKRGRGRLNEPMLWNWGAKDGATVNPSLIHSGGVEQGHQKVSALEGPSVSNVNESSSLQQKQRVSLGLAVSHSIRL